MSRTNILTIIFLLVLLALGYLWVSYLRSRPTALVTSVSSALPAEGREFLTLLKTLETIKIDSSLLEDPVFKNLKDGAALPPTPSPRGRLNPFLPLK